MGWQYHCPDSETIIIFNKEMGGPDLSTTWSEANENQAKIICETLNNNPPRLSKSEQDRLVKYYCQSISAVNPDSWCYSGDLISESNEAYFICGNDPKDIAEVRRRSVTYRKIDLPDLIAKNDLRDKYHLLQLEYQRTLDGRSMREQGTQWREGYFDGLYSNLIHAELKDQQISELKSFLTDLSKSRGHERELICNQIPNFLDQLSP